MTKIIVFQDGSWEWIDVADTSGPMKFITITLGENWHDSEVSSMVKDYFTENVEYLFE